MLERVEQVEEGRKEAKEAAHSYPPPTHSDGFYGTKQGREM